MQNGRGTEAEGRVLRRQADDLARDMIKRGLARITFKPAREALSVLGPSVARAVISWASSARGLHFKRRLVEFGIGPVAEIRRDATGPLAGQTIVVTGSIQGMSRLDIQQLVRRCGGTAASDVSKATSLLVIGENPGSKVAKAQSLGVKTISAAEFLSMTSTDLDSPMPKLEPQGELL